MLATTHERPDGIGVGNARELLFADVDPTDDEALIARSVTQPERRLFFAVLSDAIVRFRQLATTPQASVRAELMEAERWIRSDDRRWPCSFVNVCEALDIAYQPLRRALLQWRSVPQRRRVTRRGLLMNAKRSRATLAVER